MGQLPVTPPTPVDLNLVAAPTFTYPEPAVHFHSRDQIRYRGSDSSVTDELQTFLKLLVVGKDYRVFVSHLRGGIGSVRLNTTKSAPWYPQRLFSLTTINNHATQQEADAATPEQLAAVLTPVPVIS